MIVMNRIGLKTFGMNKIYSRYRLFNCLLLLMDKSYVRYVLMIILSGLMLTTKVQESLAGFDKLVKDVFPSGTMSNITSAGIVREQEAGHFVGGSVIIKTSADPKLHPFHVQAPSCKLGGLPCGAQIELMGGAVSMVSGQELMRYLKTLPQTAATYGAMMAIKTMCSPCHQLLEYLDAKADWLNNMSIDKCKTMQSLMDPLFPKENAKSEALRQTKSIFAGDAKDMADIQKKSRKDNGDPTKGVKELESQLGENYNLVWKALDKKIGSKINGGKELKELLMSISGTIIGTKGDDRKPSEKHLKSLINKSLIKDFIGIDGVKGKKLKLYVCDEAKNCLKPVVKDVSVGKGAFLYERLQKIVASITAKIKANSGKFSAEEEVILALSSEQLLLKIEMGLATYSSKNNALHDQDQYIELLAYDVATGYLQTLLNAVQEAVGEYSRAQIADSDKFEAFGREARETMRLLARSRGEARGRYDLIAKGKIRLKRDVRYFRSEFEEYVSNYDG